MRFKEERRGVEKPVEIVWFERIMFATLALGVIQSWLTWPAAVKLASPAFVVSTQIVVVVIMAALILLISRRRSNVARWILIILTLIGLPAVAKEAINGQMLGSPILVAIQTVSELAGLVLLFTPRGRIWFRSKPI